MLEGKRQKQVAAVLEKDLNEIFQRMGLTMIDGGMVSIASVKIKPNRVKESPITFECEMVHHYFLENHKNGGACIIIGKIVMMHFDDNVLLENYKINIETYKPVSRLAGSNYSKLGEIFSLKRD